ncbi:MAG TPA: BON domain-containing protein [Acidimicrobiales bacterium]
MSRPASQPGDYLVRHIQDALASDPRALELGVEVTLAGDRLVLSGTVATEAQRRAIADVVAEVAPGHEIVNQLAVVPHDEAGAAEELT